MFDGSSEDTVPVTIMVTERDIFRPRFEDMVYTVIPPIPESSDDTPRNLVTVT